MHTEKKEKEEIEIELKVDESGIAGRGIVRVNDEVLPHLTVKEMDKIVVFTDEKSLLLKVVGDKIIKPGHISIRTDDIEHLSSGNGQKVKVKADISLHDQWDGMFNRIKDKFHHDDDAEDETGKKRSKDKKK